MCDTARWSFEHRIGQASVDFVLAVLLSGVFRTTDLLR